MITCTMNQYEAVSSKCLSDGFNLKHFYYTCLYFERLFFKYKLLSF